MPKRLPRPNGKNHLIETLSSDDQALLQPHLTAVSLEQGMILEEPGQPVERIIFPVSGVISTVAMNRGNGRQIEAGLSGREGMSGTSILLGVRSTPNMLSVQIPGDGLQLSTERLSELLRRSPSLQQHLLRFVQTLLIQTSQTSLSNKHSSLEERLARWLLMCHDRVEGDLLNLTHEFMSIMLGVRRSGVTVGTQILEGNGLIRAKRGAIIILDRAGLEEKAGGSYGVAEVEYLKLFGSGVTELDHARSKANLFFMPGSKNR